MLLIKFLGSSLGKHPFGTFDDVKPILKKWLMLLSVRRVHVSLDFFHNHEVNNLF